MNLADFFHHFRVIFPGRAVYNRLLASQRHDWRNRGMISTIKGRLEQNPHNEDGAGQQRIPNATQSPCGALIDAP